ncbi:titin [Galendromus occidentalis]|uniref:Titin n=1 Tax=Galendromus occidentalis TaxID=34638 RepID=A0AAJ7SH34_9ACAR|nr:titin [Galendromus occidentalis]
MYIPATPETAPGPPRNVRASYDYEVDTVRLTWDLPESPGPSKIQSFVVERCASEDGEFKEIGCVDPELLWFCDGDISGDVEYLYRILSLSENESSEPSAAVKVFTECLVDLPDSPEGPLHITCTTSRSCSLSWRQPISGPVQGYSIWKRRQDLETWTRVMTVDGDIQECTVGNLDNHFRYSFKVHSENRAGSSLVALKAPSLVHLKTGTRKPNAPRGPLVPTVTGPSSMYIEWGPCENDGGAPLRGYTIWIKEVPRKIWVEIGNVEPDVCIFTVRDLLEGHEYSVKVAAFNELGVGPPLVLEIPIAIIRPEGVVVPPSAPIGPIVVKNISPTSMMVSWKAPCDDGGGPVEAYIIEQREILEADIVKSHHETDGPETYYIAEDLTQNHYYCFRIYAVNEAGVGEALVGKIPTRARAASVRPPQPDAPLVELHDHKPRTVRVSWDPVEGDIECYLVERSQLDEEEWQLVSPQRNFRETSLLCSGLFPGIEYVFRVSAENDHGLGKASQISEPIAVTAGNIREPRFCKDLKDMTALAGDLIQFDVEFCGEPEPEIIWMHDGAPVQSEGRFEVLSVEGASSLRISPVMMEDEAGVACEANNPAGKSRTDAKLSVHARPEILPVARYSHGLCFDAGESLRIKLPYVGSPKPRAEWLLNGKPLDLSSEGVSVSFDCGNAVLEIDEITTSSQGTYTLKIDNQYGTATLDIAVSVTGEPERPSGLYLTDIKEDNCVLHWVPPENDGGSPITNYVVEKLQEGEVIWTRCGTSQKAEYRVFDLEEGGIVVFRVSAVNIFGQSEPSDTTLPTKMSPEVEYQGNRPGKISAPSSSVSAVGVHQDSVFQDISAQQERPCPEIRPEFWATPDLISLDSCVPETLLGGSQPHRDWEEATAVTDDTLDSVSELSSFQAEYTDYYSGSPHGTVASSNDTVLDMEMSELMNLVSHDYSGSDNGRTVVQRAPPQVSHVGSMVTPSERSKAVSPTDSLPLMTVIEASRYRSDHSNGSDGELTVRPARPPPPAYADAIAEIHQAEECLEDLNVTPESANLCTEPVYLHSAKSKPLVVVDGVPLIQVERKASLLEDIHEADENLEPASEASDRLLVSLSKAESATDSCLQILEKSPRAESNCSSISDIASLEDSIEREYNYKEQKMESLEAGLEFEMASLERDLSLLKVLQGAEDEDLSGSKRTDLVREIGRHGELFRPLHREPPRPRKRYPKYSVERRHFERLMTPPNRRKFYAERTGSIFKIPSSSGSDEDEVSSEESFHETPVKGCAPKVISHLRNRHIQAGCRIKLSCSIDGDPCPEIFWFRNGRPLALKNRHFVVSMLDFNLCTLEIYSVRSTDTGEYSLVAKNPFGECSTSAYLRVTGSREESPEKPRIRREKEAVLATKDGKTDLNWNVRGWPLPSVQVYHELDRIRTDLWKDLTLGPRGECRLKFHKVSPSDEGVYTCLASNKYGRAATTIVLAVGGDSSTLAAAMDPMADISYSTRNRDRNLPLGFYDPDVTGSNFPEYVEDIFERPVCWFRTHHVPFLRNLQKGVKELPELRKLPWPPLNPKFTEVDRNSVTLCWEKPMNDGGSKIYDFKVEAREIHTRNWREKATSRSSITTVYGLKPGTTYVFRVAARNKYGEGQAQVSEPVTTRA